MPITDNLISYWKLEEASGTRVDSHGTNNLTDNNTVTQAAGKLGNAAQFTAANSEYLSITDNASLSMGDIDFSLTAWVYFDSLSVNSILYAKEDTTGEREYRLDILTSDKLVRNIVFDDANGVAGIVSSTSFGALSTATWYFVFAYHDSVNNQVGISINDGTVNTAATTAAVGDSTSDFIMGRLIDTYLDGRLDSCGIWKRVLTAAERTDLYNGGAGLEYPFTTAVAAVISRPILSYRHNQRTHRIPGTINPSWPI